MRPLPKLPPLPKHPRLPELSEFTERLEYLLIVILTCTALLMLNRTCLPDGGISAVLWSAAESISAPEISEEDILPQGQPAALLFMTKEGRCGLQYDQEQVSAAYTGGAKALLDSALSSAGEPEQFPRDTLPELLAAAEGWAYYDFLADIPFFSGDGKQNCAARKFLLIQSAAGGTVLCYGNSATGLWYRCSADHADRIAIPENCAANGAFFAFERPAEYGALDIMTMILPDGPDCPVYSISNPMADPDDGTWNSLAHSLGLNAHTATLYEAADGLVMRDGSTTLRIQRNGTLTYRVTDTENSPFAVAAGDEQEYAESLLAELLAGRGGQVSLRCGSVVRAEDGSVRLIFYYYLNGVRMELKDTGWAARVTCRSGRITVLELCFRTCTALESRSVILPARQAAAAAASMGLTGQALELYYPETGQDQISAAWAVRTGGVPADG